MKAACAVTQSFAMNHPYKWAIENVFSGKMSLKQWILVITNSGQKGARDSV